MVKPEERVVFSALVKVDIPKHRLAMIHRNGTLATDDFMNLNESFCAPTHAPIPIVLTQGRGARVWDVDGIEYIDFLSAFSVVNQGHCHPKIVAAMTEQCQKLAICTSAFQNENYPRLCEKVCKLLGYEMVASTNSGAEGVDLAIKFARKWGYQVKGIAPDQAKILTVAGNYHGKTLCPLSGSSFVSIREGFGPFVPGVGHDLAGFPVRFNQIQDIERTFEAEGSNIAAFIVECVQGYAGSLPAEPGYLKAVSDLCKRYNVLFIADEIQTGFGRTGTLMAYQHDGVKPDMVVLGKALTSGMYPMSMVVGSKAVMTQVRQGEHSSTYAANPLASAVAIAAIDVTLSEKLADRAEHLGRQVMKRLQLFESKHTTLRVTGRGLLISIHLDESHPSGKFTAARLGRLVRKRGLLAITAENRIKIAPPLMIEEDLLWKGIDILDQSLRDVVDVEDI